MQRQLTYSQYSQKLDSLWRDLWRLPHSLNFSLSGASSVAHRRSLQRIHGTTNTKNNTMFIHAETGSVFPAALAHAYIQKAIIKG